MCFSLLPIKSLEPSPQKPAQWMGTRTSPCSFVVCVMAFVINSSPVLTSHNLIKPSSLPVATILPSRLKEMIFTGPSWGPSFLGGSGTGISSPFSSYSGSGGSSSPLSCGTCFSTRISFLEPKSMILMALSSSSIAKAILSFDPAAVVIRPPTSALSRYCPVGGSQKWIFPAPPTDAMRLSSCAHSTVCTALSCFMSGSPFGCAHEGKA
mmetsp:Transcript_75508/g.180376  ORF Transcript_75508/g.180376 Transcript_75508/m.180376 type:complete len:209 (-) Transcript_75508:3911-4537(-)